LRRLVSVPVLILADMVYKIAGSRLSALWFVCVYGLFAGSVLGQDAIVRGRVTDFQTGEPLIGANVVVINTPIGSSTNTDGQFVFSIEPGSYRLRASFIGYSSVELQVTLASGDTHQWNPQLVQGTNLDPIQVTAGRRQEKVLDAPASIDVITAREIQGDVTQTTARSLRNITGLDIVQTGVDRYEIALRGFNNVFSRSTHVLTDYRKAGAASIGVNLHNVMPNLAIDIDRIEIVRGPGSALYGPGVDSGVIHYFSKDAFDSPGMTLSMSGGQRSSLNLQGRYAAVLGKSVGLKVVGSYARSEDFILQECDPELLEAERFKECPDEHDAIQLFVDGPRDPMHRKFVGYAGIDLRLGTQTRLSFSGGLSHLNGTVLSSLGTVQARDMIANYAQIRMTSGPVFVQAYLNTIDSRESYIYGGGIIGESSEEVTVQGQYTKQIGSWVDITAGIDLTLEHIDKLGAYFQSTARITDRMELTLALRGDYNNVVTNLHLSPRVALVVKPTPSSSLRTTYNRSLSSPLATDYFLNLVAATLGQLNVRARGGGTGFTFDRDPSYLDLGAPTSLVASSLLPGREGTPTPVGIETGTLYQLIYEGLIAIAEPDLLRLLEENNIRIPSALLSRLTDQLSPENIQVQGFSPGVLGLPNLSTLEIEPRSDLHQLQDVGPIQPAITQTWEVGYRGILDQAVVFSVDGYYARRKNFTGPLQALTPFVLIPNLQRDLIRDLAAGLNQNDEIGLLLRSIGLTPESVAELIVDLAGDDLPDGETPVAIVQPNENNPGVGAYPELMLTFPNFGNIQYFGVDLSASVILSDQLSFFGNASWVSDDYFDHTELSEETEEIELALNAPGLKFKLGGQYQHSGGLSVMASGRFISGFPVLAGQYIGDVPRYQVFDLGLGYSIKRLGIRADIAVNNVLNSQHREFIGAPRLGRVIMARLTYTTSSR